MSSQGPLHPAAALSGEISEFENLEEPQRWWVIFQFDQSHRQMTEYRILEIMLTQIWYRQILYTVHCPAGMYPLAIAFDIISMTNTEEDILDEAEIIVVHWIMRFEQDGLPFGMDDIFEDWYDEVSDFEYYSGLDSSYPSD